MDIKTVPGICPLCKSNNIDFGETDFSFKDTAFIQECVCCDCNTKYIEVFGYTHSEISEKGE